jgi:hypothetical protein
VRDLVAGRFLHNLTVADDRCEEAALQGRIADRDPGGIGGAE